MDYIEITNNNDIKKLMDLFNCFHDSCIKELMYCSGGYVGKDRAMYPFNSVRCVKIVFQSQGASIRNIEMKFDKISKLNLVPRGKEFDCIIYDASLKRIDNLFYWAEWGDFKMSDLKKEDATWISAERVSWRPVDNELENDGFYHSCI